MKKAFRYRFYPTSEQEQMLKRALGCCRYVYNRALATRTEAWTQRKERLSGYELMKQITLWKRAEDTSWLREAPIVTLQQSVNNLEVAFRNFFAQRASYPTFKKKASGGSCRYTRTGFCIRDNKVRLAKLPAPIDIRWSRPLPEDATPSQCTVSLAPSGEWHISFLCDVEIEHLPKIDKQIGLDMGLTALVATSDGEKIVNPKTAKQYRRKLAKAQQHASRKQKGSSNRRKANVKVARVYRKIADSRKDRSHKLTTRLVRENQTIVVEDLCVRNMLKNHRLAGSISDAGWRLCRWCSYCRILHTADTCQW